MDPNSTHKIAQADLFFFLFATQSAIAYLICWPPPPRTIQLHPLESSSSRNFTQILLVLINQKRMCPPAQTLKLLLPCCSSSAYPSSSSSLRPTFPSPFESGPTNLCGALATRHTHKHTHGISSAKVGPPTRFRPQHGQHSGLSRIELFWPDKLLKRRKKKKLVSSSTRAAL